MPAMPRPGGRGGQRAAAPNAKDKRVDSRLERAGGILRRLRRPGGLAGRPGGLMGGRGPLVRPLLGRGPGASPPAPQSAPGPQAPVGAQAPAPAPAPPTQDAQSRWQQMLPLLVRGGFGGWGG